MFQKNVILGFIVVLMVSIVFPIGVVQAENEVISIFTADDLDSIRENPDGNYRLMKDIDLSGYTNWEPIGSAGRDNHFTGMFDGNGYTISNLTINREDEYYVGLFGVVRGATIKNIGLNHVNVKGKGFTGGLVGTSENSTIEKSYVTGTVNGGYFVGGIVGHTLETSSIKQSYATATVQGIGSIGGLVGNASGLSIEKSYATGTVYGDSSIGGLAGTLWTSSSVKQSYAVGTVNGNSEVGGLVGRAGWALIEQSYATGTVDGKQYVGGLVGREYPTSTFLSSYWDKETTDQTVSAGGEGKTTLEMKRQSTYLEWDFDHTWMIVEGMTYPVQRWEGNGTEEDPYIIRTPQQMDVVRYGLAKDYKLGANIDLVEFENWEPIGSRLDNPFTGTFDGNGYTISNLTIDREDEYYVGLFGMVDGAMIKNIGLNHVDIKGHEYTGALVGNLENSLVENSYVTGSVHGIRSFVGGLVGLASNSTSIKNSHATGNIAAGSDGVGGLVGNLENSSSIEGSYATGTVDSKYNLGGLVGVALNSSIKQSYATGNVNGIGGVGGLVGAVDRSSIEQSYVTGVVHGNNTVGGLIGINYSSVVANSYWDIETTGQSKTSGGGKGLTTAEMKQQASFIDWDFDKTWFIVNGQTYPIFLAANQQDPVVSLDVADPFRVTYANNEKINLTGTVSNLVDADTVYLQYTIRDKDERPLQKYEHQILTSDLVKGERFNFSESIPINDDIEAGTYTVEVYAKALGATGTSEAVAFNLFVYEKPVTEIKDLYTEDENGNRVEYTPGTWTSQDIQILVDFEHDVEAERQYALVKAGQEPMEEDWQPYKDGVLVAETGKYTFYVRTKNEAGFGVKEKIKSIWLDKEEPASPSIVLSEEGWTNAKQVTAEITIGSEPLSGLGNFQIKINDENWNDFSDQAEDQPITLTIEEEGETVITARARNQSGMESLVSKTVQIDRTPPEAPVITASTTDWTNQPVTVDIQHGDAGLSGVDKTEYKIGEEGKWEQHEGTITIIEDGKHNIYARTWDNAGNVTEGENIPVEIVKINKAAPMINVDLTYIDGEVYEPDTWTNQEVTVAAIFQSTADTKLINKEVSVDGGERWKSYDNAFTIEKEGTHIIQFKAVDEAGNETTIEKVIKIDTTNPTKPDIDLSYNDWTNQSVEVAITDGTDDASGFAYVEYRIGKAGDWNIYDQPIKVDLEGETKVEARSVDKAGNVSAIVQGIVKLDTTHPVINTMMTTGEDSKVYGDATWTKHAVTVSIEANDANMQQLQIFMNGTLQEDVTSFAHTLKISQPGYYEVVIIATDQASNETKETKLIQIDQTAPTTPVIQSSHVGWTSAEAVQVSITAGEDDQSGVAKTEYRLGKDGDWQTYNDAFSITVEGETTIEARTIDEAGNISESSQTVVQIKRTTPSEPIIQAGTVDWVNVASVPVSITAREKDSVIEYQLNTTGGKWLIYTDDLVITDEGVTAIYARGVDQAGNASGIVTATVSIDRIAPELSLEGDNPVYLTIGENYSETGYQVSDNLDKDVTVTIAGKVDTNQIGVYELTYTAIDHAGNQTIQTRTVFVVDEEQPVINLKGDNPVILEVGTAYKEAGATAQDNVDGDLSDQIIITDNIDTTKLGHYQVIYLVTDSSDNQIEVTRTVEVVDTTAPSLTLKGDPEVTIELGESYQEAGVKANDNYDGDLSDQVVITGSVDTHQVGIYQVTYTVTDSSSNVASITRNVHIMDTVAPNDVKLEVTETTTNSVIFNFSAADRSGVKEYVLSRDGKEIAQIGGQSSTYIDEGLKASTAYSYQLVAVDESGNASKPITLKVTTKEEINPELEEKVIHRIDTLASKKVTYGTALKDLPLPAEVKVILTNGEQISSHVIWNKGEPTYDGKKSGSYFFTGELILTEGLSNLNQQKALIQIHVEEKPIKPEGSTPEESIQKEQSTKGITTAETNNQPDVSTQETGQSKTTKDAEALKLPYTATNQYIWLLTGLLLLLLGGGVWLIRKKRT